MCYKRCSESSCFSSKNYFSSEFYLLLQNWVWALNIGRKINETETGLGSEILHGIRAELREAEIFQQVGKLGQQSLHKAEF
jgi:hypothetical protein